MEDTATSEQSMVSGLDRFSYYVSGTGSAYYISGHTDIYNRTAAGLRLHSICNHPHPLPSTSSPDRTRTRMGGHTSHVN